MRFWQAFKRDLAGVTLGLSLMWLVPGGGWWQVLWALVATTSVRVIARQEARRG